LTLTTLQNGKELNVVSFKARYWVLYFLLYINDLPKIINKNNNMVLFADDTSIIVTDINKLNFEIYFIQTFKDINMWFTSNLLALNFDKTQYMECRTRNYYNVTTQVNHGQISLQMELGQILRFDH
jgi:hypothetical protein